MNKLTAEEIIERYTLGQCTEEERRWVEAGFLNDLKLSTVPVSPEDIGLADLRMKKAIDQHINAQLLPERKNNNWTKIAIAASLLLIGSFGLYFFIQRNAFFNIITPLAYQNDVKAGSNKAYLTLADGKKISLTDVANGDIVKHTGLSITKTADGQLVYTVKNNSAVQNKEKRNTISTPKGGQWQVHLPDGSTVWLNAESALTYPVCFSGLKDRRVELKGEAYFEITKDKSHPFIVHTQKQEVIVLGTHFNINSYSDENATRTTLLEGSVRVQAPGQAAEVLKPGEQSVVSSSGILVKSVDPEEAIAWKNGYFMFNNEKQESILRRVSRWYNVEVAYADPSVKELLYYGNVSRFENISKVLRKLEQTSEVRFEIEGNKIIVHKR